MKPKKTTKADKVIPAPRDEKGVPQPWARSGRLNDRQPPRAPDDDEEF